MAIEKCVVENINTILDYAHMWNWGPDWSLIQEIYVDYPQSYAVLLPFAYCYLEELIRSRTSQYKHELIDEEGNETPRKTGQKLIKLARKENAGDLEFLKVLDSVEHYFDFASSFDHGENRNSTQHGFIHSRFWTKESFEQLISDIADISPHAGF